MSSKHLAVLSYRFFVDKGIGPIVAINCTNQFTGCRNYGKALGFSRPSFARRPVRVYSPDGQDLLNDEKSNNYARKSDANVTKADDSSTLFSDVMSHIHNNKRRSRVALEGTRLIKEAFCLGIKVEYLFVIKNTSGMIDDFQQLLGNAEIHRVPEKHFMTWSSVTTPPGLIGVCRKTEIESYVKSRNVDHRLPLTVICDNIREPGNLGAILRSAAAAGCESVILTKGCTDPWESKVLRGGSGAHFYVPIVSNVQTELLGNLMGITPPATIMDEDLTSQAPTDSSSEDLNNNQGSIVLIADSNLSDSRSNLPITPYTEIPYARFNSLYLVIGGETEGIGRETLALSQKVQFPPNTFVTRINVPLFNNFDSLNAAHACSVIIFEIVRQCKSNRAL